MIFRKQDYEQYHVNLSSELLKIRLTTSAARALENSAQNLFIDMQTHLGCMPRKKIIFSTEPLNINDVKVTQRLSVSYQSLIGGEACAIGGGSSISSVFHYDQMIGTPRWLCIDFYNGKWSGDFGLIENPGSETSMAYKFVRVIGNLLAKPDYS